MSVKQMTGVEHTEAMNAEPEWKQRIADLEARVAEQEKMISELFSGIIQANSRIEALEGKAKTGNDAAMEVRVKCLEQLLAEPDDDEFSTFWKAYPRKVAVAAARKAFKAARKKESLDGLLRGLERYKVDKPAEHPWKHASSWLNGECWKDDYKDRQDAPGSPQAQSGHQDSPAPESKHTGAAVEALAGILLSGKTLDTAADDLERHRMARQIRDAYAGNKADQHDRNILWTCGYWRESGVMISMSADSKARAIELWRQAIMDKAANLPEPIGRERFAWPEI